MLLPPSGDMGQNRAIVPEQLRAINAAQPRSMTNTDRGCWRFSQLSILGYILGNQVMDTAGMPKLLIPGHSCIPTHTQLLKGNIELLIKKLCIAL